MYLTENQEKTVQKLFVSYLTGRDIVLQSPTGSGKTFMIYNLISLINDYENSLSNKVFFIFESLSKAKLSTQIYESLTKYDYTSKFNIKNIVAPSNKKDDLKKDFTGNEQFKYDKRKSNIFVFGSDSYKRNAIFADRNQGGRGILREFLREIASDGYKIVYFRDELHTGNQSIEKLLIDLELKFKRYFNIQKIHFTATPDSKNIENKEFVKMSVYQAQEDNLIKNQSQRKLFNDILNKQMSENNFYESIFSEFLSHRVEIKEVLRNNSMNKFNPLMFVQISNKNSNNIDNEVEDIKHIIDLCRENKLNYYIWNYDPIIQKEFDKSNIPYYQKISDDRVRTEIGENNNDIDIVFFKQALTTGIDIPRANFLLQLRQVNSEKEFIQTIGRIKRNPFISEWENFSPKEQNVLQRYYVITENKNINEEIMLTDEQNSKIVMKKKLEKKSLELWQYNIESKKKYTIGREIDEMRIKKMLFSYFSSKHKEISSIKLEETNIDIWKNNNKIRIEKKLTNILELHHFFYNYVEIPHRDILMDVIYEYEHKISKKLNPIKILIFIIKLVDSDINEYNRFVNKYVTSFQEYTSKKNQVSLSNLTYTELSNNSVIATNINKELYYESENKDNHIYLDSSPEETLLSVVEQNISKLDLIDTFTRHYLPESEFYISYKIGGKIKKSYVDFVAKDKNGIVYLLEVKSSNDYNEYKTDELRKQYLNISTDQEYKNYRFIIPIVGDNRSSIDFIENGILYRFENIENGSLWKIFDLSIFENEHKIFVKKIINKDEVIIQEEIIK